MNGPAPYKRRKVLRGQPLIILLMILGSWVAARAMLWETPLELAATPGSPIASPSLLAAQSENRPIEPQVATAQATAHQIAAAPVETPFAPRERPQKGIFGAGSAQSGYTPASVTDAPVEAPLAWPEARADTVQPRAEAALGHQLVWMEAMAHLPVPSALAKKLVAAPGPERSQPSAERETDRWSLDAWGFWRSGRVIAPLTQGRLPIYGASQAGGVLSYRLAPASLRDPKAYLRAYRALVRGGETELAAGLNLRPVGAVPLRAHAELRATDSATGLHLRPAALVTSELPPLELPAKMRAEVYLQGGYVAGRQATAFFDGQAHILRDVARFDLGKLSLGTAAWGGAQRGASRVDVGPSLRVDFTLGKVPARASLDWRERVEGNAAPRSGVAATLSTRF